ncbi:MAG TPA: DUF6491 family protein [Candidatus Acidoferrum sp.]|nr:DUF6491 family protein [Candidatus Acidoferrum sp.]
MKTSLLVATACAFMLLGACKSPTPQEKQAYAEKNAKEVAEALDKLKLTQGEPETRLYRFRVNGFKAINQYNLVVYAGVKERYLITLMEPCIDLPFAWTVGLQSYTSMVDNFDSVIVRGPSNPRERCHIDKVYKLNPVEQAVPATAPAATKAVKTS